MADKIWIDTQLLEQMSSQITQLQRSLISVNQKLAGSLTEVRRVASGQDKTIRRLSNVQKNTMKAADRAERLAKATRNAAANWAEAESRVTNQKLPEADSSSQGTGGGGAGGDGNSRFPFPFLPFKWGTDSYSGGSKDGFWWNLEHVKLEDLRQNPLYFVRPPWSLENVVIGSILENGLVGTLQKLGTGKLDTEGALLSGEAGYGDFFVKGSIFGGSFKTKGKASWDLTKGEVGITGSVTEERYLAQVEGGYKGEHGELTSKATVGSASATGEVGLTLFQNGEFDPAIYAKAKAEAYAFKSEVNGKLGNDDYNVYVGKETTLLGADAEVKAGYNDGKFGVKTNAEAYVVKGEIKGGFEILGFKIGGSAEVMVGANATAGGEVGADGAAGEIGLGPIKVKLNIDWSGFAKRFL